MSLDGGLCVSSRRRTRVSLGLVQLAGGTREACSTCDAAFDVAQSGRMITRFLVKKKKNSIRGATPQSQSLGPGWSGGGAAFALGCLSVCFQARFKMPDSAVAGGLGGLQRC